MGVDHRESTPKLIPREDGIDDRELPKTCLWCFEDTIQNHCVGAFLAVITVKPRKANRWYCLSPTIHHTSSSASQGAMYGQPTERRLNRV